MLLKIILRIGSGKTTFVETLLSNPKLWSKSLDKIIYCYGIETDNIKKLTISHPEIVLFDGLPRNLDRPLDIFSPQQNNVIFFDDLSSETQNSKLFTDLMTKGSHHCNCALISLEHFLFSEAKERRKQTHHWHQIILFR